MSTKKTERDFSLPAPKDQEKNGSALPSEVDVPEKATPRNCTAAAYSHGQLIQGAAAFSTTKALVQTALLGAGKTFLTREEAAALIQAFKTQPR